MTNNQNNVFWYLKHQYDIKPIDKPLSTDVVIVGGGMAGLTAAQSFREKGCSVVVLEKSFCGAGASGKSSGFITPDSELDLNHFVQLYGIEKAKKVWEFVESGSNIIQTTIKHHNFLCDYQEQDTLVVANTERAFTELKYEHAARHKAQYESTLYDFKQLQNIIGSTDYYGGIRYGGCFGISSYLYIQSLKQVLLDSGVQIFENSGVTALHANAVDVNNVQVNAKYIVLCVDRFLPEFSIIPHDVYQVQTFLMISKPLTDKQITQLFPDGPCMVWDTDLIYHYYRLTGDGRLLLGGSTVFNTFADTEQWCAESVYNMLKQYWSRKFPTLKVEFEYRWPGLIGVSKDVAPIAGYYNNSVYFITAATGLSWAAALGNYSADHLIDSRHDFDAYFDPDRSFPLGHGFDIFGKRVSFGLSNLLSVYYPQKRKL